MNNEITPAKAQLLELVRSLPDHHVAAVHYMVESTAHAAQIFAPRPPAPSNVIYGPWKRGDLGQRSGS